MNVCFVVHSVLSCWNNGNAHFLRGVAAALRASGHRVAILEPHDGWSRQNLAADAGDAALREAAARLADIGPQAYRSLPDALDRLAAADPDLVVVHEWNPPALVNAIGAWRKAGARFVLLFHDTHHRALSRPDEIERFDLSGYDGVVAFGACIARLYERRGWGRRAWPWHEAADIRAFRPIPEFAADGDVAWIGNWGDGERGEELREFLFDPVETAGLTATVYGVRYPAAALAALARRGISYGGWLPNHRVPQIFSRYRATVHVPRRPYAQALPGIPTIRVFEALACGIPLVSAPWHDEEALFPAGAFLWARDGEEMTRHLRAVVADPDLADALAKTGLAAVRARHTCDHRAAELLAIYAEIAAAAPQLKRSA